jgi:hypothetical protein
VRELEECRALLAPLDHQELLAGGGHVIASDPDDLDDDALLAELGVSSATRIFARQR